MMKLAIMQPYFFPYLGYFQLMNYVDEWVIFDQVQFIDKGWVNRNRVLHPDPKKDWQFITVPLAGRGRFDHIDKINIVQGRNWIDAIMGKLSAYRKAPYYKETVNFVYGCLSEAPRSLDELLEKTLRQTAQYLGIQTPISVQSRQNWSFPVISHPGQWALEISRVIKAAEYVNPFGGSEIFCQNEFDEAGIKLSFLKPELRPYVQYRGRFIEGLSILDVMMWNDKDRIRQMLMRDFTILTKRQVENG